MKISVKDGKSCEKILSIRVDSDHVQSEFNEFFKAVAPKAKVPGFRPGKAPKEVLAIHYRDQAREHVLKHLISESYEKALKEKELHPLGVPDIREVQFDETNLSFNAHIETRPKVKLSKYKGLRAKREAASVKPEDVEARLKQIQESLAQYKAVEDRPSQMGDFVIADYVCVVGGKEIEKRENDWFELKNDEFLKGLSAQLVGVRPGDDKEAQVTFPENIARKELAGKPAVFKIKIREIKNKTLPLLDDELAKEAGEYKNLDELKKKIQDDLRAMREHEQEVQFENALMDELMRHNAFELPEQLLKRRTEELLRRTREDFRRHGNPDEAFDKQKDQILPEIEKEAKKQVQLAFLLDEIAEREQLQVSEGDLKKKYEQLAARSKREVGAVEKFYNENEQYRESLSEQIRNEKAVEFIKVNAKQK